MPHIWTIKASNNNINIAKQKKNLSFLKTKQKKKKKMMMMMMIVGLTAGAAPEWDAELSLHSSSTVEKFNARCLDGSPGGFYFRPALNAASSTKWKFHFMGGVSFVVLFVFLVI